MTQVDQRLCVPATVPEVACQMRVRTGFRSAPLLRCMRVEQWIKNLCLFAGVVFTPERGHAAEHWLRPGIGFLIFCFLSAAVYIINDIADAGRDRQHPIKRFRPIAAGEISARSAAFFAASLALVSMAAGFALGTMFGTMASAYFLLTLAYSFILKQIVIADLLTIAVGFVLRAVAGAVVVDVPISPWLLVCTGLLALFLGLTKRRAELATLQEGAGRHRGVLGEYSPELLDQWITAVLACTLMAYTLYTFNSPTAQGHPSLMATIPFVIYGLFRYLYLVHRDNAGGSIATELIADRPLLLDIFLWGVACWVIVFDAP
jgi:4-hydroxybenzoate polyprenyltransferase